MIFVKDRSKKQIKITDDKQKRHCSVCGVVVYPTGILHDSFTSIRFSKSNGRNRIITRLKMRCPNTNWWSRWDHDIVNVLAVDGRVLSIWDGMNTSCRLDDSSIDLSLASYHDKYKKSAI